MRFFHSLKLYGKLLTTFAMMACLCAGLGILAVWSLSSINAMVGRIYTSELQAMRYVKDSHIALVKTGRSVRSLILAQTDDQRDAARAEIAQGKQAVAENLPKAQALFYVKVNQDRLQTFQQRFQTYSGLVDQVVALATTGNAADLQRAAKMQMTKAAPLAAEAEALLIAAADSKVDVAAKAAENAESLYQWIRGIVLATVIGCVGLALFMGQFVAKLISTPITRLTAAAESIARGDIEQAIDHRAEDETGQLADAFRSMTGYINSVAQAADTISQGDLDVTVQPRSDKDKLSRSFLEMVAYIQGVATAAEALGRGDLTMTIPPRSDKDLLSRNFNKASEGLRAVISQISNSATSLSAASQELTTVATQISSNSEQTSAEAKSVAAIAQQLNQNVHTVASSSEEMSASIKEIARSSHEASRVALDAVKLAQETNTTVTQLGDSSSEVGNVVKVITSVAQQTKLLALNATIEAAGAGEAGKGFAVVASEVKELAKETAKATDDISLKIDAIQSDTRNAVEAIGTISTIISQINALQLTTSSAVEEQAATTAEISRNVAEAAAGTSEIARSVLEVAKAAEGTSIGAADAQKASAELASMAVTLTQLVGKFRYA